jgi:hypothetical protein
VTLFFVCNVLEFQAITNNIDTNTSVRQVTTVYIFNENYYISSYGYLGGAMAVILWAIFSVFIT